MFSKYEIYTSVESVYCYEDSMVLINRLGLHEQLELKRAEEITAIKQYEMLLNPIKGHFIKTHLCRIHRFLFEDIYDFAGKVRKEQIGKANTWFYPPDLINRELNRVFLAIKENDAFKRCGMNDFYDRLAYVMAELNIIHPFREGEWSQHSRIYPTNGAEPWADFKLGECGKRRFA